MFPKIFENPKIRWVFACVLFSLATLLLVGSFESRLANTIGDDHPIVLARIFNHPENWLQDFGWVVGKAFAVASLPNLIASYLERLHSSFPYVLSWLYIFIQNLGLGLVLMIYQRNFCKDPFSCLIGAIFVYFCAPWTVNLAYYPSLMHTPYPGHLVMPFLVLGAGALLQEKWKFFCFIVCISGLIHPSLTLQFIGLAILYLLWSQKTNQLIKGLWASLPGVLASFSLPLFLIPKPENPLTAQELIPSALNNPHLVPWKNEIFWSWEVPSVVGVFWLAYLGVTSLRDRFPQLVPFFWANATGALLAALSHFLFVQMEFLPGILICPLRITVLCSIFLIPIGFQYLLEQIKSQRIDTAFISVTLLFLLLFSERGLFWGPLIALSLGRSSKAFYFFLFWLFLFFLTGAPLRHLTNEEVGGQVRYFFAPGFNLKTSQILVGLTSAFFLHLLIRRAAKLQWVLGALLLLGGGAGLWKSFEIGQLTREGSYLARWELQKWAKNHTHSKSVFMMDWQPWRGVSERQVVVIGYLPNRILPYFKFREPLLHEKKLEALFKQYGLTKIEDLREYSLRDFASLFKAQYFVASAHWDKLNLPIVFENQEWRVYAL